MMNIRKTKYNPTINEQDTDTLIAIANSYRDKWYPDAVEQAKEELQKRNISIEYQKQKLKEWDNEIKQREIEYKIEIKNNIYKRYSKIDMLKIFFSAPSILVGKNYFDTGPSLIGLWKESYKTKFKQRIILLFAGSLFWIILIIYIIKYINFQHVR